MNISSAKVKYQKPRLQYHFHSGVNLVTSVAVSRTMQDVSLARISGALFTIEPSI